MTRLFFGRALVPLSPAVRAGDLVFVSGQVPVDTGGTVVASGIEEQTRQTMENVISVLAMAGCTIDDVVKTVVVLADAHDFPAFNKVYAQYFSEKFPARTTMEASLMIDVRVEIEAIAYKPL